MYMPAKPILYACEVHNHTKFCAYHRQKHLSFVWQIIMFVDFLFFFQVNDVVIMFDQQKQRSRGMFFLSQILWYQNKCKRTFLFSPEDLDVFTNMYA